MNASQLCGTLQFVKHRQTGCVSMGMCLTIKPSPSSKNLEDGLQASNDYCRLALFSASRIAHFNH
ncbi:hypothetical protein GT037_005001 [Alternaria burnsii]|uniref:Uncharacterized protein n=1 Tax=Alternaria burnsii TaxID=1187904 RepID=A0A8H7B8X8_9PLEO|nr:uncharacterized protein GT037_005001 [Alternaria burnsii]KAF7676789.1 hypothetical protein GT037_005001 [Alternaria burnsii]